MINYEKYFDPWNRRLFDGGFWLGSLDPEANVIVVENAFLEIYMQKLMKKCMVILNE